MSNMDLWNQVCETPTKHTKRVNQRGGFTAIDAHYQVMRATELFGPVGQGWGYFVEHGTIETTAGIYAVADVNVWHTTQDQQFGPWRGCAPLVNNGGRVDADAPKKATTDALTKALSHIGIGADIFLGLYDDNKYVSELKAKESGASQAVQKAQQSFPDAIELATDKQVQKIQILVNEVAPNLDRESRLKRMNGWLVNACQAKAVSSTKELTKSQANKFIDALDRQKEGMENG